MAKLKKIQDKQQAEVKTGRPHKLTSAMHKQLVGIIAAGNYHVTAAHACGISDDTFGLWLKKGRDLEGLGDDAMIIKDDKKYLHFFRDIKKAEAIMETTLVGLITNATKKDWRAGMTYLERKSPDRWGRRDRTTIDGEINLKHIKSMTNDELQALIEAR